MAVTAVPEVALTEEDWVAFLLSLPPWEMHVLFKHEMIIHDRVLDGEIKLAQITEALADPERWALLTSDLTLHVRNKQAVTPDNAEDQIVGIVDRIKNFTDDNN